MALVGQAVPEERKSAAPYSRYRSPERSCDLPNQWRMKSTTSAPHALASGRNLKQPDSPDAQSRRVGVAIIFVLGPAGVGKSKLSRRSRRSSTTSSTK